MSTALITREDFAATIPALIAAAGDEIAHRFVEFFTVNIRNRNTRAAYAGSPHETEYKVR